MTNKKNLKKSEGHNIEFLDEDGEIVDIVHFTDEEFAALENSAKENGVSTLQFIVDAIEKYVEKNK